MNTYIYIWFILGVIFIISELFIPGFTIFFFGCGAILTAIASLAITAVGNSYIVQIIIWLLTSILSLVFLRSKFTFAFRGRLFKDQTDSFAGKEAVVVDEITPHSSGRIAIRGTTWKAESLIGETFFKDETVIIVRRKESESLTFLVTGKKNN